MSFNEIVELSDDNGTVSYDVLNRVSNTTSSLNESENSVNIFLRMKDLIDVPDKDEDDKSAFIEVDSRTLQGDAVVCEEHEETRHEIVLKSFFRVVRNPTSM